jgi:hypothetical protein
VARSPVTCAPSSVPGQQFVAFGGHRTPQWRGHGGDGLGLRHASTIVTVSGRFEPVNLSTLTLSKLIRRVVEARDVCRETHFVPWRADANAAFGSGHNAHARIVADRGFGGLTTRSSKHATDVTSNAARQVTVQRLC